MSKEELELFDNIIASQVTIVDTILSRYVNDEAGETQYDKWIDMSEVQKMNLLTYTLENCPNWSDFETDLIINFDMGRY